MFRETVYKIIENIALIEDEDERRIALRKALTEDNVIAIIVQRIYHPNYNFYLPDGLPDGAKKSSHNQAGPFYNSIKKWDLFRTPEECPKYANIKPHIREQQFVDLYESIATDDTDILLAVKNKKLPWDTLSAEFVVETIPEMFPAGFRPDASITTPKKEYKRSVPNIPIRQEEPVEGYSIATEFTQKSLKEQCLWIMQNNPGLKRKDYIELFIKQGVKKSTASLYYQNLKDVA